ncbi:hypothetical protein DV738_g3490, partial [Chaetothyriales sp. CBS 135597]
MAGSAQSALLPTSTSMSTPPPPPQPRIPTRFETVITCNPPVLESLLCQVPTETVLRLYHTSAYLRRFLAQSPTAWKYISFRLFQPAAAVATLPNHNSATGQRQSGNYALDNLLIHVVNTVSTRLTSLELDNTAVSGATLISCVLALRRDSLQHLSVRGCKNVSLKYHINPWLHLHAQARQSQTSTTPAVFGSLALKSLYAYRCRHHRRRPYLPASLVRRESDSEPTHELVTICHNLGIWTDTAWCTSPGARCYRRAMYVTSRIPQDSREVWVVFDRLWRSKNWLGPPEGAQAVSRRDPGTPPRPNDCKFWEADEQAVNGEALGSPPEGKEVPAHLRHSHRRFVENIHCDNCHEPISERCESCSVMMHCTGCRKTLCASCAFDRPYLRNKNAAPEDRNKFWWAPGCAVSPCSMLDQDLSPPLPGNHPQPATAQVQPSTKFKWCCTEPIFSGGGGITFSSGVSRDTDRIRAAPLPHGHGWEDADFCSAASHQAGQDRPCLACNTPKLEQNHDLALAGRWRSLDDFFDWQANAHAAEDGTSASVPRSLCDECYASEHWNIKCKRCSSPLCVKHDMRDRTKFRICGAKDLVQERQDFKLRQKALKAVEVKKKKAPAPPAHAELPDAETPPGPPQSQTEMEPAMPAALQGAPATAAPAANLPHDLPAATDETAAETAATAVETDLHSLLLTVRMSRQAARRRVLARPQSRGSNATDSASRSSSPARENPPLLPDAADQTPDSASPPPPARDLWQGCQSIFCPPSRLPGDRRRRCAVPMSQCTQCKIHVCSDCYSSLEPSCPCYGCRGLGPDDGSSQTSLVALFFCPNCRWDRMVTGRCKRRTHAFLSALSETKRKPRRRRERIRKPINERRRSDSNQSTAIPEVDAIDGLADFFTVLNHNDTRPDLHLPDLHLDNVSDLREIRDVGLLARDLIRRIQSLRGQFRPGSAGALALPDIRLEDLSEELQEEVAQEAEREDGEAEEEQEDAAAPTLPDTTLPLAAVPAAADILAPHPVAHHDSSATEDEAVDEADA